MYPKGNEPQEPIFSGDPTKLQTVLERYVEEVLDFIKAVEAEASTA
jgi:hypothetical protein